jgi:hypothetical protein
VNAGGSDRKVNLRAVSIGLATLSFCIGGAALLGWILDNEFLKRIHPSLVTMKANTAVCLMLVGICVFLIQDGSESPIKRVIVQLCAIISTNNDALRTASTCLFASAS